VLAVVVFSAPDYVLPILETLHRRFSNRGISPIEQELLVQKSGTASHSRVQVRSGGAPTGQLLSICHWLENFAFTASEAQPQLPQLTAVQSFQELQNFKSQSWGQFKDDSVSELQTPLPHFAVQIPEIPSSCVFGGIKVRPVQHTGGFGITGIVWPSALHAGA